MIKLEHYDKEGEVNIEKACRTCYSSWYRFNPPESTKELIQKVIKKGHLSVLEHASVSFRFIDVSRVLTHELVRHRHFSFSMESQRYIVYADTLDRKKTKEFKYIIPNTVESQEISSDYFLLIDKCYQFYDALLKKGVPPEDARYILPNATCTEIVVTGNLRTWREFLIKRCHPRAHWEIREAANEIKDILIDLYPDVLFDFHKGKMTEEEINKIYRG